MKNLKLSIIFTLLFFLIYVNVALAKKLPTYENMAEFLDDFMLGKTISKEVYQKYFLISSQAIDNKSTELIFKTDETAINHGWDEITLTTDQNQKILNVSIRFFTDAKFGQELNDYCNACFPAITERYGNPNLKGLSGFAIYPTLYNTEVEKHKPIKVFWLTNNDNYRYFYGAYQLPQYIENKGFVGSLLTGSRGILFIAQLKDHYNDKTFIPVFRYPDLPAPSPYSP